SDSKSLSVNEHFIAGNRVSVSGDIGHAPARERRRAFISMRYLKPSLIGRHCEHFADAASSGATSRTVVPNGLALDHLFVRRQQARTAAAGHVRAGSGKIDMITRQSIA